MAQILWRHQNIDRVHPAGDMQPPGPVGLQDLRPAVSSCPLSPGEGLRAEGEPMEAERVGLQQLGPPASSSPPGEGLLAEGKPTKACTSESRRNL